MKINMTKLSKEENNILYDIRVLVEEQRRLNYGEKWEAIATDINKLNNDIRKLHDSVDDELTKIRGARACERIANTRFIIGTCELVEKKLDITKKALNGTKVHCVVGAGVFPGAYKYAAAGDSFTVEFKNGNWILTDFERERDVRHKQMKSIELSDTAKAAILDKIAQGIGF